MSAELFSFQRPGPGPQIILESDLRRLHPSGRPQASITCAEVSATIFNPALVPPYDVVSPSGASAHELYTFALGMGALALAAYLHQQHQLPLRALLDQLTDQTDHNDPLARVFPVHVYVETVHGQPMNIFGRHRDFSELRAGWQQRQAIREQAIALSAERLQQLIREYGRFPELGLSWLVASEQAAEVAERLQLIRL